MARKRSATAVRPWALAVGVSWLALAGGPARALEADPAPAADTAALRDQVRALTALVQTLSQRDQQQIAALTAQVEALQAAMAHQPPQAVLTTPGPAAAAAFGQSGPTQAAVLPKAPVPAVDASGVAQASGGETGVPAGAATRAAQNAIASAAERSTAPGKVEPAFAGNLALSRVVQNSRHRFTLQSGDGEYSIGLTGDIQFDAGDELDFRPASTAVGPQALSDGINARRARIGVAGTAFGAWGFALVYDAGNSSDQTPKGIETAQIVYAGLPGAAFELGYSNTFFTLDQATSSNDTLFLERASPSNIATNFNAGDARSNGGVRLFGDRYWIGGYLTGPASGDSHTLTSERLGAFERAAVQVLSGRDYSLHLGLDVDELLEAPNTGVGTARAVTLSDAPELRVDPTALLNTGAVGSLAYPATGGHVLDLETAASFRSLFWQGELYRYQISRRGLADADFGGAYGQVSWALTGETHSYNPQAGAYFRLYPRHPFSLTQGGWGAWEIAARASYVDLDSNFRTGSALSVQPAAVDGGRQLGYTLGLNWYPNDLIRFLFDYDHIDFDKANGVAARGAALGAPVGAQLDALSLRAQVAF